MSQMSDKMNTGVGVVMGKSPKMPSAGFKRPGESMSTVTGQNDRDEVVSVKGKHPDGK